MLPNHFYLAFGNLLYSIAKSDSKIQEEETEEIYRITRTELKCLSENPDAELNHFNTLLADSGFLNSHHAELSPDIALDQFILFYTNNEELFKPWIKEFCMNSVLKVAHAYGGIVTEEKQIILKLKELFKI